ASACELLTRGPVYMNGNRAHGQEVKAEPAAQEGGPTQDTPVAIYPEGDGRPLAKERSQPFRRIRDRVDAFDQGQFKQRTPFAFGHVGEFVHHGVCKRIGAPEEVRVLLRPVLVPSAGTIEAGVGRRHAVACFRHNISLPLGVSVSQAHRASALPTWVRVTVVTLPRRYVVVTAPDRLAGCYLYNI